MVGCTVSRRLLQLHGRGPVDICVRVLFCGVLFSGVYCRSDAPSPSPLTNTRTPPHPPTPGVLTLVVLPGTPGSRPPMACLVPT